ncbi:hypothetical protein [Sphingobacterium sp.]|uniref:hypothetical protein n=1 Tax=Sphingobacterium sp. TaxID=341027 RepID=UPI002FD9A2D2
MESKSIEWLYALEHNLTPQRLIENLLKTSNQSDAYNRLEDGVDMFRPYFVERLCVSQKQAKTVLVQVVVASDKIYDFLIETARYSKESETTEKLRYRYLKILSQLESLLEDCGKIESDIFYQIPLTSHSTANVRLALRQKINILQHRMMAADIDAELSSLLVKGLLILVAKKGISRAEVSYALTLLDVLKDTKSLETLLVEDLLFQLDFNTPTFFNYWVNNCNRLLDNEPNLYRQKEILIGMEDRFNGLIPKNKMKCMVDDASVSTQLKEFLKEKKRHINQRIKLRRAELQDIKLAESGGRILFNLSVAQFGLLIRLFIENGLLMKEDIRGTFAHFAAHFRTPKTTAMSAESLQKKSTDVEFSVARKMKGLLINMVNWINENYNTPRNNATEP